MDLDKLLFLLSCAKEEITRPVFEIICTPNYIRVAMIDGTALYFSDSKVVNDDDTGQTRNSSDADEQTHEGRQ